MLQKNVTIQELADSIAGAAPDFDLVKERLAVQLYRLLAEGEPVTTEKIAESLDLSTDQVEDILSGWPGVYYDDDHRVVGFWGLAISKLSPTHRFEVDGRALYAWCAWDTLFLPGILGATARIESTCPVTKQKVSLVVGPNGVKEVAPAGAVVSFLMPDRPFDADVVQSFCHFVHFFASEEAGAKWVSEHPGTYLLSLDEAFELGRLTNEANFKHALAGR